ncbi:MAG: BatD family protein [bacterium]
MKRLACLALIFCFPFNTLFAAEITLDVEVSRQKIFLGESFNLNIKVDGADRGVTSPDLSAFAKVDVQLLGSHSNTRSSISIINGRMTRESYEGRTFAYQITPKEKGRFHAGPIRLTIEGKTYTHPGVSIDVAGVEQQAFVIAKVSASSTSILVEEPFTVTLSIAVADLPEPYAASNEPIFPNAPPHISVDFLEINRQQELGLKGPDLNQLLNGVIDQTGQQPSFSLNNYQSQDMMNIGSLFDGDPFKPRPIRFRFPVKRKIIQGKSYREYTLALTYTPTKEGDFTFGPLTFKGNIISGVNEARQAISQDVYTIGPAVTIRVTPPPDDGRPDCFIGAVGRKVETLAALDATTCKVGDPLTLTLEVTGSVSISNMRTPLLGLQPELTKDFRVYDDNVKSETLPNGKRFTYRVRPLREGTLEFPSIKIGYYNSEHHAYEILRTQPIPIQAKATTQIATATKLGSEQAVSAKEDDDVLPCGITVVPLAPQNDFLLPPLKTMLILLVSGPFVFMLVSLATPFVSMIRRLREFNRTSGALRRARAACRKAKDPATLARIARHYIAERFGLASGIAMTPDDVSAMLLKSGMNEEVAEEVRKRLGQLDESMYRPDAHVSLVETAKALAETLTKIDVEVKK